jgi:hypothetical protein
VGTHPIFFEVDVNARFISLRVRKLHKMGRGDIEKKGVRRFADADFCEVLEEEANKGLGSESIGMV